MFQERGTATTKGNGFYNIGVTPTVDDLGRGSLGPFGYPLAFVRQFAFDALDIQQIPFPIEGAPIPNLVCNPDNVDVDGDPSTCDSGILGFVDGDFEPSLGFFPVCEDLDGDGKCGVEDDLQLQRVAVDGAFKTPGLRNIAEMAPYFHNGGSATLMDVVEFYNRGGNFCRFNRDDLDPDIRGLGLTQQQKDNLVSFMISLSDPRVLVREAPFDGPEFGVPDGHPGNETTVSENGMTGQAEDDLVWIPAVGAGGSATPMPGFLGGVNHFAVSNTVAGGVCSPNFPPAS